MSSPTKKVFQLNLMNNILEEYSFKIADFFAFYFATLPSGLAKADNERMSYARDNILEVTL